MNKGNIKWSVLDTLFVLMSSLAILLLILWIAGQIIGRNQFEQLPVWAVGMTDKIWGFLVSGAASVVIFWLKPNKAETPNYLLWIFISTFSLLLFVVIVVVLFSVAPSPATTVKEAKILFRLDFPKAPDELAFIQQAPVMKSEIQNIIKQPIGYFQVPIDLPKSGEKFVAIFKPLINDSKLSDSIIPPRIELCFTRIKEKIPSDYILAIMKCNNAKLFELESADKGCVELCNTKTASAGNSFSLFPACFARPLNIQNPTAGWVVPNLTTLNTKKQTGFTQINIKSLSLSPDLAKSNRFIYSIRVNQVPIFIDGFLPKELIKPFKFSEGINLEFGLQNLGFSGKNDGYEKIEVLFKFYENSNLLKEVDCIFDYVALRSSPRKDIAAQDGSKFQLESIYKIPAETEYEIFNLSSTSLQEIRRSKERIDKSFLTYNNSRIVGVIRPPLPPNKNYGVILGLEQSNKQIIFTFRLNKAKEIISWAKQQPGNFFSKSIYLYRITDKQKMTQ